MRKWITRIAICGLIGISFGWFWHHEWVKPCKKVSERLVEVSNTQEKAFKSEWERQARTRYIKSVLASCEKGVLVLTSNYKNELKNELCKLTRTEKPVKIYQGRWSKDCLEVTK